MPKLSMPGVLEKRDWISVYSNSSKEGSFDSNGHMHGTIQISPTFVSSIEIV